MPRKSPGEGAQGAQAGKVLSGIAKIVKTPHKASKVPFRLKSPRPLEASEQAAVFQYAALQARTDARWGMLFAIPNGKAASSIREAVNAKRTGLKRGVPDMFLPVPVTKKIHDLDGSIVCKQFAGLFIELKRQDGKPGDLSPEQRVWLESLNHYGYKAILAYGWKSAVESIAEYLGKEPNNE